MTRATHPPWDAEKIERPDEVEEFLATYRAFVTSYYGERCVARSPACACCVAWVLYDLADTVAY